MSQWMLLHLHCLHLHRQWQAWQVRGKREPYSNQMCLQMNQQRRGQRVSILRTSHCLHTLRINQRLFQSQARAQACFGPSVCTGKERDEDDYKQEANPLPPLPVNNDEHYPQENHHYFETKNYLRNDKYKLSKLVEYAEDDLPSIMSAYRRSASTSGKW